MSVTSTSSACRMHHAKADPSARVDHVVAFLPQRFDGEFADKGVVLDHKYAHGSSSTF